MNNEEIDYAALSRDKADVALDVMFAAAGIGMLAAIRQGLDLEGGLAQIIGPRRAWKRMLQNCLQRTASLLLIHGNSEPIPSLL